MAVIKRFNDVGKWVATEIVSEKDKKVCYAIQSLAFIHLLIISIHPSLSPTNSASSKKVHEEQAGHGCMPSKVLTESEEEKNSQERTPTYKKKTNQSTSLFWKLHSCHQKIF